ncbi:MAG TPA: glycogen synthase [Chitinispirillaceae bacterium]|nr:glycogen synthase [Chitinispirillaceae bacterium]
MYIIEVSSECAPFAKVGGLADVVFGLSRELSQRGNLVEIIVPKYDCIRFDGLQGLQPVYNDLWVPWFNGHVRCTVWTGQVHGRRIYLIDSHSPDLFFSRNSIYGCFDDVLRFSFFCKATLEFLLKSNKRPDIIHCHDWQTGLLPVLLYEIYKNNGMIDQRVQYTIHNFKHQGVFNKEILFATGLNRTEYFYKQSQLRDERFSHLLNSMKGGIVYSNFINTVSPHHAWEARFTDQGFGLSELLHTHQHKFGGILNGIDYNIWNPEVDKELPAQYSVNTLQEKYRNKDALRDHFLLTKNSKPVIAYIGRLDDQKGLDLIEHTAHYSLRAGAQFILLGSGSHKGIDDQFRRLKSNYNGSHDCHIEIAFSEELSHLIYAGADMVIIPSCFEPCGLTQMIAMKYGTVPVVRSVGGLASTVFDREFSNVPWWERNGFVFQNYEKSALETVLSRAIGLYYNFPGYFKQLMINGMRYDYSWSKPGNHYLNTFNYIRAK